MHFKRFLLMVLLAMGLTACDDLRDPYAATCEVPDHYKVELWTEHERYEFGESVHLRLTLTNLSKQDLTLRSESESVPVIDIEIGTVGSAEPEEHRVWSQEHPDKVRYDITLAPGESHVIEWELTLSHQKHYAAEAYWFDLPGPRGNKDYLGGCAGKPGGRLRTSLSRILYGILPPGI